MSNNNLEADVEVSLPNPVTTLVIPMARGFSLFMESFK